MNLTDVNMHWNKYDRQVGRLWELLLCKCQVTPDCAPFGHYEGHREREEIGAVYV